MNIHEYINYDAIDLSELIKRKEVSVSEVVTCSIGAINKINPKINAVVEIFKSPSEEIAGNIDSKKTFSGVPFLIKDFMLHKANIPVEMGSRLAKRFSLPYHSHLMSRYQDAGLVTLGRTKTPEMGFNITTESLFHGPVSNPWNLNYSSGGSSGGAAAAVASGMVPMAHASDGGGSIRIPASCCGVFGLKPTRGRVPIGPNVGEGLKGFATEHVVSRSVRDSAAMLDEVHGSGVGDPYIIAPPERPYLQEISAAPKKLKIAFSEKTWEGNNIAKDTYKVLQETIQLCQDLGHEVVEASPKLGVSWDEFLQTTCDFWSAYIAHTVNLLESASGQKASEDNLEKTTLACYHYGNSMSAQNLLTAEDNCNIVSRNVAFFFQYYDIFLTPTLPDTPQLLGIFDANANMGAMEWVSKIFNASPFTPIFNTTGQPAMSVPLGYGQNNLPIGMQFAARFGDEASLFQLAAQLEKAKPWEYEKLQCKFF